MSMFSFAVSLITDTPLACENDGSIQLSDNAYFDVFYLLVHHRDRDMDKVPVFRREFPR